MSDRVVHNVSYSTATVFYQEAEVTLSETTIEELQKRISKWSKDVEEEIVGNPTIDLALQQRRDFVTKELEKMMGKPPETE